VAKSDFTRILFLFLDAKTFPHLSQRREYCLPTGFNLQSLKKLQQPCAIRCEFFIRADEMLGAVK
jgi:hypothetical protein